MKQLFIFFFISFSFFSFGEVNSPEELPQKIQESLEKIVKESVVHIQHSIEDSRLLEASNFVLPGSEKYKHSNGFAIAENILVATSHGVEDASVNEQGLKEVFVRSYNGHLDKAVVLVEEPAYDLAILKTKRNDYKPLELASEITLGEDVYALGFKNQIFQLGQGAVFLANFHNHLEKNNNESVIKRERINYLMLTQPGMSGVPIVSKESLKVIGMHFGSSYFLIGSGSNYFLNKTMQYGVGTNVSHIKEIINKNSEKLGIKNKFPIEKTNLIYNKGSLHLEEFILDKVRDKKEELETRSSANPRCSDLFKHLE